MKPARGLLLVRPVEAADTVRGGCIIVPDTVKARMTAHQAEVVAVGVSERCDDPEVCERLEHLKDDDGCVHACEARVGDWLIVRPRSFIDTHDPDSKLWLVRQSDVLAIVRER